MQDSLDHEDILIIDRQQHWRSLSARALREQGLAVSTLDTYEWYEVEIALGRIPDIVLLGCPSIEQNEQELITQLLGYGVNLLVLCSFLSLPLMRSLFIAGVKDVAEKSYNPQSIVQIVNQALQSIKKCDTYGAGEKERAL